MDYTKRLAQFAVQLQYSDLPAPVIEKVKEFALHALGVQLAGSTLPWSKSVYRYIRSQGSGETGSTILNYGLKTTAGNAAFANGTFGHGFEMDDNHAETGVKGGCVVVPAALALAEQQHSSGKEFILATIIAYELMIRTALSVTPVIIKRALHPTAACGPFGAGAAVGKLLRFDEDTMLHTLSIAAAHSAGLQESPASGRGTLKRIYGGMAASNGIRAALLASAGLTGPATMLEGRQGFCYAFGDNANLPALTADLGTKWHILDAHYKIYAQDGFIQPMTEALERILKRRRLPPDEIAEIKVGTNSYAHDHVVGVINAPKDVTSAQFSANFSLALFLIKGGAGFSDYTEDSLSDARIIELSKKVTTEIDPELEAEWQKTKPRGARVTVRLVSGETDTECVHMLRGMSREDIDDKFRRLAGVVLGDGQCDRLLSTLRNLETVPDVSCLLPELVSGGSRG